MRINIKRKLLIGAMTTMVPLHTFAQETCEPVHSIPYMTLNGVIRDADNPDVGSTHYNLKMTVGQPIFLDTETTNLSDHSMVSGLWSHYLKEPRAPILQASDGDFQDMVLLEWTIEDDQTGPPVTGSEVTVYRNGYVLATLPIEQTQYQDFNVFSGEHYTYGVTSSNQLGESKMDDNQGFTNPNGVITGHIETPSGNPVIDTKVVLTPNIGKSAFFNGTNNYIYYFDAHTSANRQFSGLEGDYTIETWFRSVHTVQQTLFAAVDSSSSNHYVLLELTAEGKVHWEHNPVAGTVGSEITTQYSFTQSGEDAKWHHLAVVNENNGMTMYIDGAIVGTKTASGPISDKVELVLAKLSPYDHTLYFNGRLDDFRIWSLARSWEDIRKHSDLTLSGEEWGLAAYWKFDEVDGEIIFDLTENNNDGSLCGMVRDGITAPVFVGALSDSTGNYQINGIYYGGGQTFTVTPSQETSIGRSLRFTDGDYISFTGQRIDLTGGYTLEGWAKSSGTTDQMIFAAVEPGSNIHRLSVSMTAAGALQFSHYSTQITSAGSFNDNLWHHWAMTFVDTTTPFEINAYVDGVSVGTATESQSIPNLSEPVIGKQSPDSLAAMYFTGLLDEFRLWDSPRTGDQIGGTMNQPLSGDNYGLINYWRMNDGTGELTVDGVDQVTGTLHQTAWDRDIPLREVFTHWYEPESRQATLNASNTSVDLVDFTDQSMIPISGFVRYENTACFQEGVEILVNGESLIPPIYTDSDGKFIIDREPGTAGDLLSVVYQDHVFSPPLKELPLIVQPITGIYFDDKVTHTITGVVAGGSCEFPILPSQGEITITAVSVDGCTERTVTVDPTDKKRFTFENLPPLVYNLAVEHPDPEIDFVADTISLETSDRNRDFIYHADPKAEFTDLPGFSYGDFPVIIDQRNVYGAWFHMFEPYGDNICDIEAFSLDVVDNISDTTYSLFMQGDSTYIYFTAKKVNILSGGSHPYQKNIGIVLTDTTGRSASNEFWALVQGDSKIPGVDFSTTTSKMPWYILRVPPGDQSYTYMTTEQTLCNSVVYGRTDANIESGTNTIHAGADFEIITGGGFGVFAGIGIETETTADISDTWQTTNTTVSIDESINCLTTSETYTTSGDGLITGDDATVFIGGGYTVSMGAANYLTVDTTAADTVNPVHIDTVLTMDANGVTATYIHSKYYIKNHLMPDLWIIAHNDSATTTEQSQALTDYHYWEYILEEDSTAIADAIASELLQIGSAGAQANNISFDAGSDMEYSYAISNTSSHTSTITIEEMDGLYSEAGVEVNGIGYTNNSASTTVGTDENTQSSDETLSQTIGFVLSDDDPGDGFSFSVKRDQFWNMPVFNLIGGQSSCPYEAGSIARQVAAISVDPGLMVDVLPDEGAVSTITVGNSSSTGEGNYYNLSVLTATNPGGAVLTVDGLNLAYGMDLFLNAGEVIEKTLVVTKGPVDYDYNNITLQLASLCEVDIANDLGTLPTNGAWTDISVHFQQPCSESNIFSPENGWLVTSADAGDTLFVTINGFDRLDPNLEKIELQYRKALVGGTLASPGNNYNEFAFPVALFENSDIKTGGISKAQTNTTPSRERSLSVESLQSDGWANSERDWSSNLRDTRNQASGDIKSTRKSQTNNLGIVDSQGNTWSWAATVLKDSLIDDFVIIPWNISPTIIMDGSYELRSLAYCQGSLAKGISPTVTGLIDRSPPQVLGLPEPVDEILGQDDLIRVTLNEDVACGDISIGAKDIQLFNSVKGKPVAFQFTCGGNVITIEPEDPPVNLENQTFRAEIRNLADVYGNMRADDDPIIWEFFVNRNPIEWVGSNIDNIFINVDEEYSVTRQLINNGGSNRSWDIIGGRKGALPTGAPLNLPSWLEVSPMSGTLTPGSSQDVSISLVPGLNFGEYKTTVYAAGTMGDEPMIVDIRKLCYPPEWNIDPTQFQYTMTITATISADGELSEDVYDVIGVFSGEEIRSVANVQYVPELEGLAKTHPYEVFLTVYSNEPNDEDLSIRVYDASQCLELGMVEEEFTFVSNSVLGTPTSPVTITATSQIIQTMNISGGWTWFSLNLESTDMSVNSVLNNLSPIRGDLIKSQTAFDQYIPGAGWVGTLDILQNEPMYQIRLSGEDTLQSIGYAVDVELDTIPIVSGWNWIGYLPQVSMDVNVALLSLKGAATGDLIKSQFTYAQFVEGLGWIGSMLFMNPELGYLMKTMNPGELVYPFEIPPALAKETTQVIAENAPDWSVNPTNFEYNMTITGVISMGGEPSDNELDMVGAFVGDECRGVAQSMYISALNQYLIFLMVYSNYTEDETVKFRFFDASEDYILNISETIVFEPNLTSGTADEPFNWNTLALGIGDPGYIPDEYSLSQNYPNPFNPITKIGYGLPEKSSVSLTIFDLLGREVRSWQWQGQEAGYHFVTWDAVDNLGKTVGTGIYFYHIVAGDFVQTRKMLMLK